MQISKSYLSRNVTLTNELYFLIYHIKKFTHQINFQEHIMRNQFKLAKLFSLFLYYLIAIILFVAGINKLINSLPFANALFALKFSPNLVKIIMFVMPIAEIAISVLLILKIRVSEMLSLTSLLFLGFLAFSIYGVKSGLSTDCGCFGGFVKSAINWKMILRNSILFGVTAFLSLNNKSLIPNNLRMVKND